jgi:hypothetical protein
MKRVWAGSPQPIKVIYSSRVSITRPSDSRSLDYGEPFINISSATTLDGGNLPVKGYDMRSPKPQSYDKTESID